MPDKGKIKVFIWEHSPEIAANLSALVDKANFRLTEIEDADVVIIGPSIDEHSLIERKNKMHEKGYVLITSQKGEGFFNKAHFLFEILSTDSLDDLPDAVHRAASRVTHKFKHNVEIRLNEVANLLGIVQGNVSINIDRIRSLVSNLPLGVILISRKNGILGINPQAEQILQTSAGEIIGISYEEFDGKFNLLRGGEELLSSLADTERPLVFVQHLANDIVVEIFLTSISGSDEFLLILNDITEQSHEREWIQGLMDAIGDGVLVLDKDRNIIWSNRVISEWFGNKLSNMPAHCFNLWTNSDRPCPNCPAVKVFDNGEISRYTERFIENDGTERYFDIIAAPIKSSDGEVRQIVQLARDVTIQENIVKELRDTKQNFEEINKQLQRQYVILKTIMEFSDTLQHESSLDKIIHIVLTAVTAKEGLGFNRSFILLVDDEKKSLVGKSAVGPSNAEEAGRIWAELSDEPKTLSQTLRAYQKATEKQDTEINRIVRSIDIPLNSNQFLVRTIEERNPIVISPENEELFQQAKEFSETIRCSTFVVAPLWAMTKLVGVLVADNMITQKPITHDDIDLLKSFASHASLAIERSMLTEKLQESYAKLEEAYETLRDNQQKLVEAEKLSTIGAMSAQIAHEIRNPLVSIGGFARSMISEISPESPQYAPLKIIIEEEERLEKIIEDVLGYAKLKEPEMQMGDINQTIYDTLLLFEPEFEDKNVKIEIDTADEIPPFLFDPNQLRQVFINLIRNSLNVLGKNGRISITSKQNENNCCVQISDNGPEIPQKYGEKIFQPFFTTRTSGTGLGLSISAKIIEAHGGTIWYKNNSEGGVTFFMRLPMKKQ